jgi:hypothetical protein
VVGKGSPAAADIERIHPARFEKLGIRDRLINIGATLHKVRAVYPKNEWKGASYGVSRLPQYFQSKGATSFRIPPIWVTAVVAQRRKKLADQIAVRTVKLHKIKARFLGTGCRPDKALNDVLDLLPGYIVRRSLQGIRQEMVRNVELYSDPGTLLLNPLDQIIEAWYHLVVIQGQQSRGTPLRGLTASDKDQPGPTSGPITIEIDEL